MFPLIQLQYYIFTVAVTRRNAYYNRAAMGVCMYVYNILSQSNIIALTNCVIGKMVLLISQGFLWAAKTGADRHIGQVLHIGSRNENNIGAAT